jgi:hypothetical protein
VNLGTLGIGVIGIYLLTLLCFRDEFIALLVKLGIAPLKERREETEDKAAEEAQPVDPVSP